MAGPNSGVGTENTAMPAISSTAITACGAPTMARPSASTAQKVTTMQTCDSR